MNAEDVVRLRELLAKATPGPWALHKHSPTTVLASDGYSATNTGSNLFDANARNQANAALMVGAVNALPALLALAEAVSKIRALADEWGDWNNDRYYEIVMAGCDESDMAGSVFKRQCAAAIYEALGLVPLPGGEATP